MKPRLMPPRYLRRARQRGVVAVMSVIWLMVALIGLMALDIANIFWQRREMQRLADTAALAAGQMIGAGCDIARSNATGATRNSGSGLANLKASDTLTIDCGHWDPRNPPGGGSSGSPYFVPNAAPLNAVNVNVARTVPFLFAFQWNTPSRVVSANATAASPDMNSFSIGTGVFNMSDSAPVNRLLNGLLGTTLNLNLASYQGLATSKVKLADLIGVGPINAGTLDELLEQQVTLKNFVLTAANALNATDTANAVLLQGIAANIKPLTVRLGDLIDLSTATPSAASLASLNVFDTVLGAAQIANQANFVDLGTMVNLPNVASVGVKLAVIEPPKIAVGPVGTVAHSAQVRALLEIKALNITLPNVATATVLNLPVYLEAASGTATLETLNCTPARANASVKLAVETGLLSTCLTGITPSSMSGAGMSNAAICSQAAPVTNVAIGLTLPLLGTVPVADVGVSALVPLKATSATSQDITFGSGGVPGSAITDSWVTVNQNGVGTALSTLVTTLVAQTALTPHVDLLGGLVSLSALTAPLSSLTGSIRTQLGTVVGALAGPLDNTVSPLLHMLGVDVGYSQIHQMSMRCGDVQLVY